MKSLAVALVSGVLLCAFPRVSAAAPILQWSIALGVVQVHQVISDGSGGCAVVYTGGALDYVAWYDKNGTSIYSATLPSKPTLIACEKNALVYCYSPGPNYLVTVVDRKGEITTIAASGVNYVDYPAVTYGKVVCRRSDKKGFFIERVEGGAVTLQRYAFK